MGTRLACRLIHVLNLIVLSSILLIITIYLKSLEISIGDCRSVRNFLEILFGNSRIRCSALRTSNFCGATISADSSSTETLCCLISVQWLELVWEMATFFRFYEVLKEHFDANR